MSTDGADIELEYHGETAPRRSAVAIALSLLAPGLGYVYVGQLLKGITVNLLFLLCLATFVITFAILKFFPLLPMLVLFTTWAVFVSFASVETVRASRRDDEYILRSFNHWTVYALVFVLSFAAPVLGVGQFVSGYLLGFAAVESPAMYPTIQVGDVALIDRSAYRNRTPRRGDVVAVSVDTDETMMLRVVGVAGDIVRIEGENVFVNNEPLELSRLDEDALRGPSLDGEGDLLAMVEENNGSRYVISVSPKAFIAHSMPPTKLDDDQLFVLADNRMQVSPDGPRIRDSRDFGAVEAEAIEGEPLYIAWSSESGGSTRWERIGLRTQ